MQQTYTFFFKTGLLLLVVLLLALILVFFMRRAQQVTFVPESFRESADILQNPYQGFYRIVAYTLSDDPEPLDETAIREYELPLVLVEINLCGYRTGPVSDAALGQLEGILNAWSRTDTQVMLRFLYDWHGIARSTEPEALSTILTHMDQVAEVVNRYEASVYLMQGCFIGNWGEMHGSYFEDAKSIQRLVTRLHQVIAPSIYLSVRTPAQWRLITGLYDVPAEFPAFQEQAPITGRLGLYNDGMLGSPTDLGTYGTTRRRDAKDPFYKGIREEELAFQNALCNYVPNGGEVVQSNRLNDLPGAVQYLAAVHASYLNINYDKAVLEKWSRTVWKGNDAFSGCDGLTYVKAHLGYRYVARNATAQRQGLLRPHLTLSLTLENTGFGNTLKPFEAEYLLQNTLTGQTLSIPISYDLRTLKSGRRATLTASLPGKELPEGIYQVFFSVTDGETGRQIALANTAYTEGKGLLIGQLEN